MLRRLYVLPSLVVLSLACSGEDAPEPPDSPPSRDAGTRPQPARDAGEQATRDGGVARDGGTERDGGTITPPAQIVPLFDEMTALEPPTIVDDTTALTTRFADRGRDRHAREDQFRAYEHYLPLYWEHRTARLEIIDPIGKGGDTIRFNIATEWRLQANQAELRFFFRGLGTVAEYFDNRVMTKIDDLNYTHEVSFNVPEGRPLQVGDRMEFELSQFLDGPPRGRTNYYGTTYLYVVGEGIVPWIGSGPQRDSRAIPVEARLGGRTTIHAAESDEPPFDFSQMATNAAPQNGQRFVIGRRIAHTNFSNGRHDESPENPVWTEQANKAGPRYIDGSCNGCHVRNGRALPPAVGESLRQYVVKVGNADGSEDAMLGGVLQPIGSSPEPDVRLDGWTPQGSLRVPVYAFEAGASPEAFSARISPQLVGLGLLEAIPEAAIEALADPDDADGDGISGRMRVVVDAETGVDRLGRFGWKAGQPTVRQQTAAALRTDMGVTTSVFPTHDCGESQADCGEDGTELDDQALDDLTLYVALLGIRPQRDFDDADVVAGARHFESVGCADCHVASFVTSPYAPHAELRSQTIAPYTDLLLHDMGPDLADDLPEGDASGAEWRTPPLWGLGHTAGVSGGEAYMHDGRARTLEEAIAWHGGEGSRSRTSFGALPAMAKQQLLKFLRSL